MQQEAQTTTTPTEAQAESELLTPDFLRKLEQLSLAVKRVFPGRLRGERRSTKRGASVEFADYRNYVTGDDFRRIDWNVYARLEKLFLKLFVEEEELHVYLLVDVSKSMTFGTPPKLIYAKRIAAALAYIGLANLDRVGAAALAEGKALAFPPRRGKRAAFLVFDYLRSLQDCAVADLSNALRDFSLQTAQPGLAIVISDFFDQGWERGILALLSRRFEVVLLHILDENEVSPPYVGDLLLVDSETLERREVTITQSLLRAYEARFAAFCGEVESFCNRYGCGYVRITNRTPFEDLVLSYLRHRGMVK
ncbi:MAG: DUF58 domain-containing protein [Armatimonadota bacterium]|nr:DUF58 domain-containing protein [Armatimonadota bacterium]